MIEGKPVPTELRNTGDNLKADLPFDEAQAGKHLEWDDYYSIYST